MACDTKQGLYNTNIEMIFVICWVGPRLFGGDSRDETLIGRCDALHIFSKNSAYFIAHHIHPQSG